ncbi:Plasmodium vivax Vir protein, putative [Plasmodium vivax]|nr:Plasmodium vivax Vir protein, putative [Plasmodium vivax]
MSDDILDIAKWNEDYPFLDKVLNTYNKYDKSIQENDASKDKYDVVCNQIINDLDGDIGKHKSYCMKLIRNLGHYSYNTDYFNPTFERCDILYNWLYHSSEREEIPYNIIEKCFEDYNGQITGMTKNYKCSYDSYKNMYLDWMKINILNIFYNNIQTLRQMLISTDNSNKTPCQNFVCECVKIYKEMYKNYCHNKVDTDPKRILTCSTLGSFKYSYKFYLSSAPRKNYKIQSLDKVEEDYLTMCQSIGPRLTLTAKVGETRSVLQSTTQERDRNLGDVPHPPTVIEEKPRNSISSTVPTALGTVAGASSILALLYKFTPGRKWIRSGLREGRGRINNNLYAGPSELLWDGMEHNDFNSYSIGYEAI